MTKKLYEFCLKSYEKSQFEFLNTSYILDLQYNFWLMLLLLSDYLELYLNISILLLTERGVGELNHLWKRLFAYKCGTLANMNYFQSVVTFYSFTFLKNEGIFILRFGRFRNKVMLLVMFRYPEFSKIEPTDIFDLYLPENTLKDRYCLKMTYS
ncbi:hypothetical protein BpHYR1_052047 [Brachionus plicatilis]|uniref:Uncharacterized protein n=1 Tax=Brachionus plicatilis TaxID=10195 RepID=A0A3M7RH09_BRAPC|nr:hypothetical protein BpHYR1_052047 [Brachionus plicatilis]